MFTVFRVSNIFKEYIFVSREHFLALFNMYNEYSPHPLLFPYIDKYWVTDGFVNKEYKVKIAVDGCIDIIIGWKSTALERGMKEGNPYIVGTMDTYSEEVFNGNIYMMGIRFKPSGITAFIKEPVFSFTNLVVDLAVVDSVFDATFFLYLQEIFPTEKKLKYIENYLIGKLPQTYSFDNRIVHALQQIENNKGLIAIPQVASGACLGSRQFERVFRNKVGISPKTYSRVIRFIHTKKYVRNNPENSLFSLAIECGYTDHSHLMKDFMEFAGYAPSFFKE